MKYVILVVAFVAMFATKSSAQISAQTCYLASELSERLTLLRDFGAGPQVALKALADAGLPDDLSLSLVIFVYQTNAGKTPEFVGESMLRACLGESM